VAQPLFGPPQRAIQLREVVTTDVAQFTALQIRPDPFDRVEVGRLAWQLLQMDALGRASGQEVLDRLAAVNGRPIPDDAEFARDRAQQHPQEPHHLGAVIRSGLGLQKETAVTAQRPAGRAVIAGEGDAQQRRLGTPRPGAHLMGEQITPRLISPDKTPVFVGRFFLSAGPRRSHQPRMAASSRCVARSLGRCTLEPSVGNRRPTGEGSEVTPQACRMTATTRLHVHTWPRKPSAAAPRSSKAGSWARCSGVSFDGRPEAGCARSPSSTPSTRARVSPWLTAPDVTPKAAAICVCFQPACFSSQARRRRPSRPSSRVCAVFMTPVYPTFSNKHRCQ